MEKVFSQTFCVVGVIIEKDGKIALIQENPNTTKTDGGKWNQPAGWLDVGEDQIIGAKRETEEETVFTFTPTAILSISSLVRKDREGSPKGIPHAIKIILTGQVDINNPKPQLDDVMNLKWFTPEEIYAMDSKTLRDVDIKKLVKNNFI